MTDIALACVGRICHVVHIKQIRIAKQLAHSSSQAELDRLFNGRIGMRLRSRKGQTDKGEQAGYNFVFPGATVKKNRSDLQRGISHILSKGTSLFLDPRLVSGDL
jgi:hypothetical protein